MLKRIIPLCVAVAALIGCSEWSEVRTEQCGDNICFTADEIESASYYIHYAAVSKVDCETDCTFWEFHMSVEDDAGYDLLTAPLEYGQAFDRMTVEVSPKTLTAGNYEVTATVGIEGGNLDSGGLRLLGSFQLENRNGSMRLK